jgi:hypothetical protein
MLHQAQAQPATINPALTAGLVDGMQALLLPLNTNTDAVTLNGVSVKDGDGTALTAAALRAGATYDLAYVAALTYWIMVGYFPGLSSSTGIKLIKSQVASNSASINFVNGVSSVISDDTYDSYQIRCTSVHAPDNVDFIASAEKLNTIKQRNYDWLLFGAK